MPVTSGSAHGADPPLTSYAIMGLLEPDTPYTAVEVERRAQRLIRFFYWPPALSHIRRELNRLEALGYVTAVEVRLGRVKRSLAYQLTPTGSAALEHWTERSAAEPPVTKDSVMLRLWLGRRAGDGTLVLQALQSHIDFLSVERSDLTDSIHSSEQSYETRFGPSAAADSVPRMRAEWHLTVMRHCLRTLDFQISELRSLHADLTSLTADGPYASS